MMNKHLKNYLDSFRFKKEHGYTLLVDMGFLGIMALLLIFFGNLIKEKAILISQGKTQEQLQQMLLSMQPEQLNAFLGGLKSFVLIFTIGTVVILAGGLLLYSLSRKLIWDYLREKKFDKKKYWRWNLLNLVLIIPLIIYLLAFGIIRLVLVYAASLLGNQVFLDVLSSLINLFFLLALIVFVFLVYFSFAEKYKVWESIGGAFDLVKLGWKRLWRMFLLVLGTAVGLSLVLWLVGRLFTYQQGVLVGANIAVSLLFLVWLRIYVLRTVR